MFSVVIALITNAGLQFWLFLETPVGVNEVRRMADDGRGGGGGGGGRHRALRRQLSIFDVWVSTKIGTHENI